MPKLIVFEGIDGCGKSTQAQMFFEWLQQQGKKAVFYKFPTHQKTIYGRLIDDYLSGKMGPLNSIPPEIPSLLYALDRYQYKKDIEKLEAEIIVCDRYFQSNLAHQGAKFEGAARKDMIEWLFQIDRRIQQPYKVILIDIPVEIAEKRMKQKNRDLHENNIHYLRKVRAVYLALAKRYKYLVINGMAGKRERTREEIAKEIRNKYDKK